MTKSVDNPSENYHDYIFKDGKLLGKFEEMYRNSSSTPWHQDQAALQIPVDLDLAIINHFSSKIKADRFCDLGCGLGFITERIQSSLKNTLPNLSITGIDVSLTAVKKASARCPAIKFIHGDITSSNFHVPEHTFNFVYAKDILWYILNDLDLAISNLKQMLAPDGYVFFMQSLPDRSNYVGKDMFPNAESIICYLKRHFDPLYTCSNEEILIEQVNRKNTVDRYARFVGQLPI